MLPKVCLYLDLDDTLYAKEFERDGEKVRKGHITLDILAGLASSGPVDIVKKYRLSPLRSFMTMVGLAFTIGPEYSTGNYGTTQKLLDWLFQDMDEASIRKMLKQGAQRSLVAQERARLPDKIYPLKDLVEKHRHLDIEVNYISIEPVKLQRVIADESGVDVKHFYQARSVGQKVGFVKSKAQKDPHTPYALIDDKIVPFTYKNLYLLNDMRKLPQTLDKMKEHYQYQPLYEGPLISKNTIL